LILFPAAFTLRHNRSTNPLQWRSSHPRAAGGNLVLEWIVPMAAVLVVFVVGDLVLCDSQACRQRIERQ